VLITTQMAEYYKNRPTAAATSTSTNRDDAEMHTMSEFDRHRETLLSDDATEGWASELRRYLGTMQRKVKKDTDIVEWWQVSILII
jgi:hypothetical protein